MNWFKNLTLILKSGFVIFILSFACTSSIVKKDSTWKKYSSRPHSPQEINRFSIHEKGYMLGYSENGSLLIDGTKTQAIFEAQKRGADLVIIEKYNENEVVEEKGAGGFISTESDGMGGRIRTYANAYTSKDVSYLKVLMFRKADDARHALNQGLKRCINVDYYHAGMSGLGPSKTISQYIKMGADVNKETYLPLLYRLMYFMAFREYIEYKFIRDNILEVASSLINAGINVNAKPFGKNYHAVWGEKYKEYLSPLKQIERMIALRKKKQKELHAKYYNQFGEKLNVTGSHFKERQDAWIKLGISYNATEDIDNYLYQSKEKLHCLEDFRNMLVKAGAKR